MEEPPPAPALPGPGSGDDPCAGEPACWHQIGSRRSSPLAIIGPRENLTAVPRPVDGGRLIDSGVNGLVRHPIYAGIVAAHAGYAAYRARVHTLVPFIH